MAGPGGDERKPVRAKRPRTPAGPPPDIRRLGPGDERIVAELARDDAQFDLEGQGEPLELVSPAEVRLYLSNPAVLFWVAFDGPVPTGFLICQVVPLRTPPGKELLLYEIGVRLGARRQGIGRALLSVMEAHMREHGFEEVWVLADNDTAVRFYRAAGLESADPQPVYMTRSLA